MVGVSSRPLTRHVANAYERLPFLARIAPIARVGGIALFLTTLAMALIPTNPRMPESGLGGSWRQGINYATFDQLAFGKQIIFSFGPFASLSTRLYDPGLYFFTIVFAILYYSSFIVALSILFPRPQVWMLLLATIFLSTVTYIPDTLFFTHQFVVALIVYQMTRRSGGDYAPEASAVEALKAVALFFPFGFLPLIKGNFLPVSAVYLVLFVLMFLWRGMFRWAVYVAVLPIIAAALAWIASGQILANLPRYFEMMLPIISGYSYAMAIDGPISAIYLGIAAMVVIIAILAWFDRSSPFLSTAYLIAVTGLALYKSFKEGFVRHDAHAVVAAAGVFTVSLILSGLWRKLVFVVVGIAAWAYIYSTVVEHFPPNVVSNVITYYDKAISGALRQLDTQRYLRDHFDAAKAEIRAKTPFQFDPARSTDIYSHEQAFILAYDANWQPRPIFQSYSAYTPRLALLNRRHLLSSEAPEQVIFAIQPIDGRYPSLADGASWPILLNNYVTAELTNDYAILRKLSLENARPKFIPKISRRPRFGKTVAIPLSDRPLFAKIIFNQTLAGRIFSLLFKAQDVKLVVTLADGAKQEYRIPITMTETGFILSPIVSNAAEFVLLRSQSAELANKRVASIQLISDKYWTGFYGERFRLKISEVVFDSPPL